MSIKTFLFVASICTITFTQSLSDVNIGIVHSELTKQLIYSADRNFYPIQDWELFFLNRKISYSVIKDEQLDNDDFRDLDVLILPSVEVLSVNAANNLKAFLKSGKGVLVFGKFGNYRTDGMRNDSDFLLNTAGVIVNEFNTGINISEKIVLDPNSILYGNETSGSNVLIMNQYTPLYANIISGDVKSCGSYMQTETKTIFEDGSAIVLSEKGNGKVAWFGFQLSQAGNVNNDSSIIEKLIINSIKWLSAKPFVMLNRWPSEYKFPVLLNAVITNPKPITEGVIKTLQSANRRINFFLEKGLVEANDSLLSRLSELGDINLFYDLKYLISSRYYSNLDLIYYKLYKVSRQELFGMRVINSFTNTLQDEILKSQFDFYLLGDNKIILADSDHLSDKSFNLQTHPNFLLIRGGDKSLVMDTLSSLIKIAIQKSAPLIFELADQKKTGNNFKSPDYFNSVMENLINNGAWITTYSELINWILNRRNITVEIVSKSDKNLFEIIVENRNQVDVRNIEVTILSPSRTKNPKIMREGLNLIRNEESDNYSLQIPYLRAGTKEIIQISFEEDYPSKN